MGEEAALRVQELASSLQECRRREAQMKEEKTEGKTDVIGAIMAAIGEMPDTLGGQSGIEIDVERVEQAEIEPTIEIMDEDVVCIEETFDSSMTVENVDMISSERNKSKLNEDIELMEEVTNTEELSFTDALEQLGGLLDFSPL